MVVSKEIDGSFVKCKNEKEVGIVNNSIQFLKELDALQKKPVPDEVYARAKRSLLDYLVVNCAGAAFQKEKLMDIMILLSLKAGAAEPLEQEELWH